LTRTAYEYERGDQEQDTWYRTVDGRWQPDATFSSAELAEIFRTAIYD
jgi:hypothetical protein